MSKIFVDQIQKSGGTVFTLPPASGMLGQYVKTDGSGNLSFGQPTVPAQPINSLVSPDGLGNIGSIVTHTDRQNIYSTGEWTSSGPWTTYGGNTNHSDNSAIQFMSMALGDGLGASGTSQNYFGGDSEQERSRQVQFSNGNRLGYSRDVFHYDNVQDYAGQSMRILPIRNTTSAPISISVYGYASQYWSSGYENCQLFYFAPNTSTYSTVTSISGTNIASSTSNAQQNSLSGTISVPANTTILLCLVSTDWYGTTYRFKDTNFFYNLSTTFSNTGITCDMRMLSTLARARFNMTYAGALASIMPVIWTKTATNYGDR